MEIEVLWLWLCVHTALLEEYFTPLSDEDVRFLKKLYGIYIIIKCKINENMYKIVNQKPNKQCWSLLKSDKTGS